MKKVFDQTVRDLKREVNKKVLKVPGIEQKVLDATSNEPWGPHGTLLADIAQATRNYHEYQMIMGVIWKRINDSGKNWRHVYKALTVLEYLVGHGSERVIDDIREHAYQISTLSDFQYIDSSGRDQGMNVRKKSQSLVVLVNDKERIVEVRQKAAANRDKFRNTSTGGMYRPNSYSGTGVYGDRYDDDRYEGRYGSREEDRNGYGYGREREYNYRDDDRYRYGDSNSRDGDRYGRDYEERYGRDGYRDDDYRGRSRSVDDYGTRGRSSDRERDRAFDDDGQSSSRGSGARADDQSLDGSVARRLERKFSEQNIGAPPSYEEAISDSRSPAHSERNGENAAALAPGASSPPAPRDSSPQAPKASSPSVSANPNQDTTPFGTFAPPTGQGVEVADEFDPRGSILAPPPTATAAPTASAAPTMSNNAEMDLLGSLSDSFNPNPLAIMPVASSMTTSEVDAQANFPGSAFTATKPVSDAMNQPFEDPFGESPFKAIPSTDAISAQQQNSTSSTAFQSTVNQIAEAPIAPATKGETVNNFSFGNTFSGMTYSVPTVQSPPTNPQFLPQELPTSHQETDILADILPPSGPPSSVRSQTGSSAPPGQHPQAGVSMYGNINSEAGALALMAPGTGPQASQFTSGNFLPQGASTATIPSNLALQNSAGPNAQFSNRNLLPQQGFVPLVTSQTGPTPHLNDGNFLPQQASAAPVPLQAAYQTPAGPAAQHNSDGLGNLFSPGPSMSMASQQPHLSSSTGPITTTSKDKFETKSAVWAETLSRGLVNLNISGAKTNPLADIGIDFDALNRKEKRMEKPTTTAVTSTVTMGKAMGSGSGIGRAGAGALRPPPSTMMGSGMGMGVGMGVGPGSGMGVGMGVGPGSGMGMGMGGYVGMNQPMGMGMNTSMNMGMGMNAGMSQGGQMGPPTGFPPASTLAGGYNPMAGAGGYTPQQPYGGGYR